VAEPHRTVPDRAKDAARRPPWHVAYRAILGSRVRAQSAYRASFVMDIVGSFAVGVTEFAELYVIFHNVPALGGLDLGAAMLVFGLANLSFSIADLVAGHLDQVPTYLRQGTLDVLLLRPLPLLAQLVTSDVSLRRLGRASLGLLILVVALNRTGVPLTLGHLTLLAVAIPSGTAIFAALFVAAGASQFWLIDGAEFANGFTYGSSYAGAFSAAVMPLPLRVFFSFVVPASFVAYLPTLALLGRPGPAGLPSWLGWTTPVAAAAIWTVALIGWRYGVRRYTGAGG
jgi:ABC-2 type transport system permease protein